MNNKKLRSLILLLLLFSYPLFANTLFIAGDSTAASYDTPDHQGWGALLQEYFDPNKTLVENRARGGRSSRTFISEGHWQTLVNDLQAGDIVIIQFGHNDASNVNDDKRARGTLLGIGDEWVDITNKLTHQPERVYSFGFYLRKMIAEVKAKKAIPILMNLTARNIWRAGRLERGFAQWGAWAYQVAIETDSAFIDLTNPIVDELEYLGPSKTAEFYTKDYVHFNPMGARLHVEKVVAALKGLKRVALAEHFSEKGKGVHAYPWSWLRLPFPADDSKASIFLLGDSTVRNGAGDGANGEWGWGDFLAGNLDTQKYQVVNRAVGGFSSRTFYREQFEQSLMMMRPGDIALLQFGHNDASAINDARRARGTLKGIGEQKQAIINQLTGQAEHVRTYGWYLRQMIGQARARGVTVVVCSPVPRKIWQGNFIAYEKNAYATWAMQVARQSGAQFIDLHQLVSSEYQRLGKQKVELLFADKHTHTNKAGANLNAKVVARNLEPWLAL